jgi:hypothetical protein
MTTPLLERVARALCRVADDEPDMPVMVEPGARTVKQWTLYIPEARASILAMRELDDDAITIACDAGDLYRVDYMRAHEAMIDAALKESPC